MTSTWTSTAISEAPTPAPSRREVALALSTTLTAFRSSLRARGYVEVITPHLTPFATEDTGRAFPVRYLDKIPPRPIFFIHGTADRVIPVKMTKILYEKAKEPKSVWYIEGAGHIEGRRQLGEVFEKRVADFLTQALASLRKSDEKILP